MITGKDLKFILGILNSYLAYYYQSMVLILCQIKLQSLKKVFLFHFLFHQLQKKTNPSPVK
jgi:hypothetical protein